MTYALCEELYVKRNRHILKTVCNKKPEIRDHPYGYTFGDITYHLNSLAAEYASYQELGSILHIT